MIDWKALLEGRLSGLTLSVEGARVGDGVDAVPLDRVTEIDAFTPKEASTYRGGRVYRVKDDGAEVELSREALLSELRVHGGRLYLGTITFQLKGGAIQKIWVRGAPLKALPFKTEGDIERRLGPPLGVERVLGWAVRHYPARALSVSWHCREGRVEHVALGPVEWTPRVWGAKDLLHEWLSASYAGLGRDFAEPRDRSSSAWVRHARITALLRAFSLGEPKAFADGSFLEGRPLDAYPLAAKALREGPWDFRREQATWPDTLGRLFWWLLVYRTRAEQLLRINSGWLEAGHPGILTALHITGRANTQVNAALAEVEELLVEMIAPDGKTISEKELMARWGFPDVDIEELLRDEI